MHVKARVARKKGSEVGWNWLAYAVGQSSGVLHVKSNIGDEIEVQLCE